MSRGTDGARVNSRSISVARHVPSPEIALPDLSRTLSATADSRPSGANAKKPLAGYYRRVLTVDAAIVFSTLGASAWLRFHTRGGVHAGNLVMTAGVVAVCWDIALNLQGAYDAKNMETGTEEFRRVATATFVVVSLVSIVSYLAHLSFSRIFVVLAIPLGGLLLILGRFGNRIWLRRQRRAGKCLWRVLVVGQGEPLADLCELLSENEESGFRVEGQLAVPTYWNGNAPSWLAHFDDEIKRLNIEVVAIAEVNGLSSKAVREIAWRLEGPRIGLIVAPALADFAGPRLSFHPVAGLPLIHLDEPQLIGPRAAVKRAFDLVGATLALLLLSPLLLLIAVVIAMSSRGPLIFSQERVGKNGETFRFLKFRTMVDGAHLMHDDYIGDPDDEIVDRYRQDPRITKLGAQLRRFSLDELPQLWNVLTGDMSLVGPRPLLPSELSLLGDSDHRRHLIQPGLTGLWQVSGRKQLPWAERMRLDLWYVENWSPALDFVIVLRTFKAVISGDGAY
jgi:exopolysaccharide biosynthesis polyprenyl glycosylphosphotransferase